MTGLPLEPRQPGQLQPSVLLWSLSVPRMAVFLRLPSSLGSGLGGVRVNWPIGLFRGLFCEEKVIKTQRSAQDCKHAPAMIRGPFLLQSAAPPHVQEEV